MQLAPGTVVDRYRVEAELGRGGMARVYRVRHVTLDTAFALKVLVLGGEDLRQRLVREGRVQARLDHPNLVAVRDVLDLSEGPALLMDYVDGPSMDRWLATESPDEPTRAQVVEGILDGVGFAHAQGVVHRDLKPANVLMERRDGVWHPRVADFGLAKIVGGEEGDVLQTRTGRPMGTPSYMAPEQVRSAKHVDARADVFALGCILYELWCDRRAFVGEDSLEVFNRVTKGRFLPPRSLRADVPTPVEAAVLGALEVDPAARIPDVATFRRVLRGLRPRLGGIGQGPEQEPLQGVGHRGPHPPRRDRGDLALLDRRERHLGDVGLAGRSAGQAEVQRRPQREEVGAVVHGAPGGLLGRHVRGRAQHLPRPGELLAFHEAGLHRLDQPEVQDLGCIAP